MGEVYFCSQERVENLAMWVPKLNIHVLKEALESAVVLRFAAAQTAQFADHFTLGTFQVSIY